MWPSWRISSFEHLSYFVPTVLLPNRKNVLFSLVCHGNRNDYLHQENALFRGTKMGRQSKGVESWGLVDSVWAWASVQQPWMGENVFTSREDHFSWLVWFIWIIFTWFFFFLRKSCWSYDVRHSTWGQKISRWWLPSQTPTVHPCSLPHHGEFLHPGPMGRIRYSLIQTERLYI